MNSTGLTDLLGALYTYIPGSSMLQIFMRLGLIASLKLDLRKVDLMLLERPVGNIPIILHEFVTLTSVLLLSIVPIV